MSRPRVLLIADAANPEWSACAPRSTRCPPPSEACASTPPENAVDPSVMGPKCRCCGIWSGAKGWSAAYTSGLVTPESGFAVPSGTRAEVVEGFRRLEMLADRPGVAHEMGRRARERVMECFTWKTKARQTREVYDWVLGRRGAKPGFGMPLRGTGARTCAVVA